MSPIRNKIFSGLPIPDGRQPFDLSLYLVANRPSFSDENLFFSKIMDSVRGGVSCVQLRDHQNELAATIKTAARLKKMLKGVPLFINTRHCFELMDAVGAQCLYLEENVCPVEARKRFGQKVIIGMPVKSVDEVVQVTESTVIDYLSVKVSASKKTCPKNDLLWGMEGLRTIRALSKQRIVAIGGLNLASAESIYRELHIDDGIAMAGGLMDEENPELTARKIQILREQLWGINL